MSREVNAVLLLLSSWWGVVCTEVSTCPCWKLIGEGSCRVLCFGAAVSLTCKMCSAKRLGSLPIPKTFVPKVYRKCRQAVKLLQGKRLCVWGSRAQQDKGDGALSVCADRCAHWLCAIRLLDDFAGPCELSLHLPRCVISPLPFVLLRCECPVSMPLPGSSCFR